MVNAPPYFGVATTGDGGGAGTGAGTGAGAGVGVEGCGAGAAGVFAAGDGVTLGAQDINNRDTTITILVTDQSNFLNIVRPPVCFSCPNIEFHVFIKTSAAVRPAYLPELTAASSFIHCLAMVTAAIASLP